MKKEVQKPVAVKIEPTTGRQRSQKVRSNTLRDRRCQVGTSCEAPETHILDGYVDSVVVDTLPRMLVEGTRA